MVVLLVVLWLTELVISSQVDDKTADSSEKKFTSFSTPGSCSDEEDEVEVDDDKASPPARTPPCDPPRGCFRPPGPFALVAALLRSSLVVGGEELLVSMPVR